MARKPSVETLETPAREVTSSAATGCRKTDSEQLPQIELKIDYGDGSRPVQWAKPDDPAAAPFPAFKHVYRQGGEFNIAVTTKNLFDNSLFFGDMDVQVSATVDEPDLGITFNNPTTHLQLGAELIPVTMPERLREYMAGWQVICSTEAATVTIDTS